MSYIGFSLYMLLFYYSKLRECYVTYVTPVVVAHVYYIRARDA